MDIDENNDEDSSGFTDSEDNLPVERLKTSKSKNPTEIVSMEDRDADRLDLKMTVETADGEDDSNIKPKKSNVNVDKSTNNSETEVSSSETDGEIIEMKTQPITHRNQYFKKFKFGPPQEIIKLPDIMMPEGFGEPIAVIPIKQEYNDDDEPSLNEEDDELDDPPEMKVKVEMDIKSKKDKMLSESELIELNAKFVFVCQMCQQTFSDSELLKEHLQTHDQKGTYLCKTCDRVYQSINELRIHMVCHIKSGNFKCEDCGKMYHHTQSLIAHRKRWHTDEKPHFCEVCGKTFSLKNDLTAHMRSHSSDRHHCEYCNKAFRTDRYLRIHTKHVHLGYKYALIECNICHKTFQKKNLLSHKKLHEEKVHKCHYCGKCMTTSYSLIAHIRRHEGIKPFICEICNKAFVDKGKLARHLHSHRGTRDYQCDLCEKSFSESQYLRQHKRTHDHTKRYPCKVCGTMFKSMNSVWSHMRKHTHKNRYECHFCGKTCYRPDHLRSHLVSHTGIKDFQCEICSKRFAKAYDLTEHRRGHSGERPYVCKLCNRAFARHGEFRRHKTRKYHLDKLREMEVGTTNGDEKKDPVEETTPVTSEASAASFRCTPCEKTFSSSASFALHCKRKSHMAKGLTPLSPQLQSVNTGGD